MTTPTPYADLADLPEDARIDLIGAMAARGKVVAFIVDDDPPEKAERYVEKLLARYPVRVVSMRPGPIAGAVTVKVGPKVVAA